MFETVSVFCKWCDDDTANPIFQFFSERKKAFNHFVLHGCIDSGGGVGGGFACFIRITGV